MKFFEMQYMGPNSGIVNVATAESGGFIKGEVTYSMMGFLTVMLMSTIYNIIILNKFNI